MGATNPNVLVDTSDNVTIPLCGNTTDAVVFG